MNQAAFNEIGEGGGRPDKGGAVAYAVSILRLLAEREQPLGANAIARELSLAPSSCFKILKYLVSEEVTEIDPCTKGYSLGTGAITIAGRALDPARAFETLRPRLEEIAQRHSITIGFWRMLPQERMILTGFAEGVSQMRIHMSPGHRLPMLVGGVGRAIAANLDLSDTELEKGFRQLRWQAPISFETYREEVRQAKVKGFGYDVGNFSLGVSTIGVTICDHAGAVRYGLSGIMFDGQHGPEKIDVIAHELKQLAVWASVRLVDRPPRLSSGPDLKRSARP